MFIGAIFSLMTATLAVLKMSGIAPLLSWSSVFMPVIIYGAWVVAMVTVLVVIFILSEKWG